MTSAKSPSTCTSATRSRASCHKRDSSLPEPVLSGAEGVAQNDIGGETVISSEARNPWDAAHENSISDPECSLLMSFRALRFHSPLPSVGDFAP